MPRVRGVLCLCAAAAAVACSARPGAGATVKPVALRIDYLPNLLYDGERLTLCASVVNRTRDAVNALMTCSLADDKRVTMQAVPAGKEARFRTAWTVKNLLRPETLRVTLTVGDEEVDGAAVVVQPASIALPELTWSGEFLAGPEGRRFVLVVRRQLRPRRSRWAVLRFFENAVGGGTFSPASALFVGDLLAKTEDASYVSLLRKKPELSRFSFLSVRPPSASRRPGPAILQTLCAFSRSAPKRRYDLVVFFVGSEEAAFGTDIEEFRRAVDLMSGLVKARGTECVAFVAPVAPARLAARVERYRRVVRSVAHMANATVWDPQAAVHRAGWDTGRFPGPDARRALADEIIRFIRTRAQP